MSEEESREDKGKGPAKEEKKLQEEELRKILREEEKRLKEHERRLQKLEERLARGEIGEDTYREIRARHDARAEPTEPPVPPEPGEEAGLEDLGTILEETIGSVMEQVSRRLEATVGSENFERRMEEVGNRVREALSRIGPRVEAGGQKVVISGSGVVASDTPIDELKCAGSGKVTSDLRAREVRVSGACRIEGYCEADEVHASGALKVGSHVQAKEFHVSGTTKIASDLRGKEIHASGALSVEGSILEAQEVRVTGQLEVAGRVETEEFTSRGRFRIGEELNAQEVDIRLQGRCRVPTIKGQDIRVRGGRRDGQLRAEVVEGQKVYLENTRADLVRGNKVRIGPFCSIDVAEAAELEVHETSTVKEQRRPTER